MKTTEVVIKLPDGCENVTRNIKNTSINFSRIGRLDMLIKSKDPTDNDIFDALQKVSKATSDLFVEIKRNTHYLTNIANLPDTNIMTNSQKKHQSEHITKLIAVGIIRRIGRRGFVMVNPYMIVPPNDVQEHLIEKWEE